MAVLNELSSFPVESSPTSKPGRKKCLREKAREVHLTPTHPPITPQTSNPRCSETAHPGNIARPYVAFIGSPTQGLSETSMQATAICK